MSKFNINNTSPIEATQNEGLLSGIQGNILASHGRNNAQHVFIRFSPGKADEAKAWIQSFSDQVTSAYAQEKQSAEHKAGKNSNSLFVTFSLSNFGYDYLGIEGPFNSAFIAGMKNRGVLLNDPAPTTWDAGFDEDIHALALFASNDPSLIEQASNELATAISGFGAVVVTETGINLKQSFPGENGEEVDLVINHFGYVDGVSQPLFYQRQINEAGPTTEWNPFASLDLVLLSDPNSADEYSFGSFMAYRKLFMDVEGFDQDVVNTTAALGLPTSSEDLVGAYAVGRFKNGTPVIDSDAPLPATNPAKNDFVYYKTDMTGSKCPFHSHTRKTNPRYDTTKVPNDAGTISPDVERGHRIARRAISYTGTGNDKGLLFLCYQADLVNQFEFIQSAWSNENNFVKQVIGQDTLIGQGQQVPESGQSWPTTYGDENSQKRQPFNAAADLQKRWIVLKGGEYFFTPSMAFLKGISSM